MLPKTVFTQEDTHKANQTLDKHSEIRIKNSVLYLDEKANELQYISLHDENIKQVVFDHNLPDLVYLNLAGCNIEKIEFPEGCCQNLKSLHLEKNGLQEIVFGANMPALQVLGLNQNSLSILKLPFGFESLQYIDVSENKNLKDFSDLGKFVLREGFDFSLEDCDNLVTPPAEIVEQGVEAIKRYFQSIKVENKEVKVVFLGNTTAGKTSLVKYLTEKEYPPEKTTHGIKNILWKSEYNGFDFIATLWDFGGQEYYHATHRLFLTNNSFYLVVWNKDKNKNAILNTKIYTNKGLEEKELQHFHYEYWLRNIRNRFAPDAEILMVQNKIDLTGEENIPPDIMKKYNVKKDFKISIEKVAQGDLKYKQKFELFETELKEYIVSFIRSQAPEGEEAGKIPRYIYNIRRAVRETWTEKFISFEEFKKRALGVAGQGGDNIDDFDIEIALKYLHDTGVLLYYGYQDNISSEKLKNIVFLKPNYVTSTIYRILDEKNVLESGGKFTFQSVVEKTGDEEIAKLFIDLMLSPNFELIFKYGDYYYASQFLPETNEVIEFNKDKYEFAFALRFPKYFSFSFITRFISRYAVFSEKAAFSRTGVIVTVEGIDFYVYADIEKEAIFVKTVKGGKKERFIRKIYKELLDIADAYDYVFDADGSFVRDYNGEALVNGHDKTVELSVDGENFIPLSHIQKYDLREYELERVFKPLNYDINLQGNHIKVEGNGNIILQNVRGQKINLNINNWDDLERKLSSEHSEILAELRSIKEILSHNSVYDLRELIMQRFEKLEEHLTGQDEKLDAIIYDLKVFEQKLPQNDFEEIKRLLSQMQDNLSDGLVTMTDEIFKYIDFNQGLLSDEIKKVYIDAKEKDTGIKLGVGLSVLKLLDLTGLPIGTVMEAILDAAKIDVSWSKPIKKIFSS